MPRSLAFFVYLDAKMTPMVPGPQWLVTVQPARTMGTSEKGTSSKISCRS